MVVFLKYYEMDDDGRRGKRGQRAGILRRMFGASTGSHGHSTLVPLSPPRERRPLRSVPTIGPQCKVDPEVLIKEYVEKETKYMGTLTDVRHDFDPGNRATLLSLLDEKRKVGLLPLQMNWQHDAILSFSLCNVKVLRRDGENLIHRIPTHQIAAAGYVQDDNQTFLFIKFASELNDDLCNLVFFCCENKALALELCCLTQQLFQLAYTRSTMDFFDKSVQDGALTPKNHSYNTDDSVDKRDTLKLLLPVVAQKPSLNGPRELLHPISNGRTSVEHKQMPISRASTLPHTSMPSSVHLRRDITHPGNNGGGSLLVASSSTPSSPAISRGVWRSDNSNSSVSTSFSRNHLQLKEYIEVLKERLTNDELRLFAQHLHHFRTGNVPIKVFCEQLLTVYTEQRKSLLLGMRHFIPSTRDRSYFERFLKKHSVETASDDVRWWDRPPKSRTTSEAEDSNASTIIHINELSSNSDHQSHSATSNDDSGEWRAIVGGLGQVQLDDQPETQQITSETELTPTASLSVTPAEESPPLQAVESPRLSRFSSSSAEILRNVEEGDPPLLRSDQEERDFDPAMFLRQRQASMQRGGKKSRGKSPSAAELGAPLPSMATGGTDDDLESTSREKKPKRLMKHKRKEKLSQPGDDEDAKESERRRKLIKSQSSESKDAEDQGTEVALSLSVHNLAEKPPGRKFFKTKVKQQKDKKDVATSSAASTPDLPPSDFPPSEGSKHLKKQEHRKKKKHKSSTDHERASASTLL